MEIGAFQIDEPLPDLHDLHALAVLRPWIDVGSVGSLVVTMLEDQLNARPLGRLATAGNFFDFTRYRPTIQIIEGRRSIFVPNSLVSYARGPEGNDFLFFRLLEPHMCGEVYADSVLKVLQKLGVKSYCLVGGMYDAVPHTKPLIVSGSASPVDREEELNKLGVSSSDYEGPTTITFLISQEAPKHNIEVLSLIVHLPQYAQLDEDYAGVSRLLEVLCPLYQLSIDFERVKHRAERQHAQLSLVAERDPQVKKIVQQLEAYYEGRLSSGKDEQPRLSPEVEGFLREIGKRFERN